MCIDPQSLAEQSDRVLIGSPWLVAGIDGSWCVRFDDHNAAYPFAKVGKQLEHGAEDSVLNFFTTIPVLFRRHLK